MLQRCALAAANEGTIDEDNASFTRGLPS